MLNDSTTVIIKFNTVKAIQDALTIFAKGISYLIAAYTPIRQVTANAAKAITRIMNPSCIQSTPAITATMNKTRYDVIPEYLMVVDASYSKGKVVYRKLYGGAVLFGRMY